MPKTKTQKQEVVKILKDKLSVSGLVVFLNFHGLSVAKATELRRALKKSGGDYVVAKKTLISIAAKEVGLGVDKKKLEGEVGLAVAEKNEDTVLRISKEISAFAKKNSEMLKIIGGMWNGVWADADQIKKLAAIPPREILLTQLAFIINQPIASLARVLKEVEQKISTKGGFA